MVKWSDSRPPTRTLSTHDCQWDITQSSMFPSWWVASVTCWTRPSMFRVSLMDAQSVHVSTLFQWRLMSPATSSSCGDSARSARKSGNSCTNIVVVSLFFLDGGACTETPCRQSASLQTVCIPDAQMKLLCDCHCRVSPCSLTWSCAAQRCHLPADLWVTAHWCTCTLSESEQCMIHLRSLSLFVSQVSMRATMSASLSVMHCCMRSVLFLTDLQLSTSTSSSMALCRPTWTRLGKWVPLWLSLRAGSGLFPTTVAMVRCLWVPPRHPRIVCSLLQIPSSCNLRQAVVLSRLAGTCRVNTSLTV